MTSLHAGRPRQQLQHTCRHAIVPAVMPSHTHVVRLHSEQGRDVVRLKGGCPSTFSRVGSELKALSAAGVPHEMVPGVSSALAAPVLAGAALLAHAFALSQSRGGTKAAISMHLCHILHT